MLVISSRFPARGLKGDQSRAFSYTTRLAERHAVTLVTPDKAPTAAAESELRERVEVVQVPASLPTRALAAGAGVVRDVPGQVAAMMPGSCWREVRRLAGHCDVAVANTVRSLRGPLDVPLVIDHVDALSLNMLRRSSFARGRGSRALFRFEAARLRRWEVRAARWVAAQVVTAADDARALPSHPRPVVIPVGWDFPERAESCERDLDVVMSGNMRYPPNRHAALWLAREIAPAVRRSRPEARILVVGRGAGELGVASLEVATDVAETAAYLSRAKIAVAPLWSGTGSPYKVIEAAAAGAAVVGTRAALAPFGLAAGAADDAAGFAAAIVHLLEDPEALTSAREEAAHAARLHTAGRMTERLEAVLETARLAHPGLTKG